MKKLAKLFLIIPIFLICAFFGVACEDNALKSINISSISNLTTSEEVEFSRGYYKLSKDNIYNINFVCNPSSYSASDLTWTSSDTLVATLNKNVLRAVGVGFATISISYKGEDGNSVKTTFQIDVSTFSPKLTFYNVSNNIEYRGSNLLKASDLNFKADQDKAGATGTFNYTYYYVNENKLVTEIVDAGTYKISCVYIDDEDNVLETTKEIEISKKVLTLSAGSYSYTYGQGRITSESYQSWPTKLLTESELSRNIEDEKYFVVKGVGKDADKNIGRYVEYVKNKNNKSVTVSSSVGTYNIGIKFEKNNVDSEEKKYINNYSTNVNIVEGKYNILSRTIVVEMQPQDDATYGSNYNTSNYKIYNYQLDLENNLVLDNTTLLENNVVNYSLDFELNNPTYYNAEFDLEGNVSLIKEKQSLNNARCLDVGKYVVKFENYNTNNNNIKIKQVVSTVIEVKKRDVSISPKTSQSKYYLDETFSLDYNVTKGNFVLGDNITDFLSVDFGEEIASYQANVGFYYYKLNNELNSNYNLILDNSAIKEDGVDDTEKNTFEVKKIPLYVAFSNVDGKYKTPTTIGSSNVQTVSYYNYYDFDTALEPNYKTRLTCLKLKNIDCTNENLKNINGNIYLEKDSNYSNNGIFNIKYKTSETKYVLLGSFVFSIITGNKLENAFPGFYESYYLTNSLAFDNLDENNFDYSYLTGNTLNLTKITIKVYPVQNLSLMSKTFDNIASVSSEFGTKNYYTYDNLGVDDFGDDLELSDILYYGEARNDFNSTNDSMLTVDFNSNADVGEYKISLVKDKFYYKEGFEYLDISLDDSKIYYFEIKPRVLTITPKEEQTKVYAQSDPEVLDFYAINIPTSLSGIEETALIPLDELASYGIMTQGVLDRELGEDVGQYKIDLGNVQFGKNYTAKLDDNAIYFTITKRVLKITPVEYNTIYGEDYPTKIGYSVEDENKSDVKLSIYNSPTFDGDFSLGVYNEETEQYDLVSKVGAYYLAGEYTILQGTFSCSSNFSINFNNEKKFIIQPRQILINFINQQKSSTNGLPTKVTNASKSYYETITELADNPVVTLDFEMVATSSVYYVKSIKNEDGSLNVDLHLYKNGIDITSSYIISLGKSIVYSIDAQVINLILVSKESPETNIVEKTYNGKNRDNKYIENSGNTDFELICQTNGYEVDKSQTSFSFKYRLGNSGVVDEIKNIGSYSAFIEFDTSNKIVINNKNKNETEENKYITFNSLEEGLIVNNALLNFSNLAYITINKADITYNQNDIEFDGSLQYNTLYLPNLKTTNARGEIFKGVNLGGENYERIELKNFDGLNYVYTIPDREIRNYDVSARRSFEVTIYPKSSNYNSLTVTGYLNIVPHEINYVSANFAFYQSTKNYSNSISYLFYDGNGKNVKLELRNESSFISAADYGYEIMYSYKKLEAEYDSSVLSNMIRYNYNTLSDTIDTTVQSGPVSSFSFNKIADGSNAIDAKIKDSYVIFNNEKAVLASNLSQIPTNAGIYICFASCIVSDNYTFSNINSKMPQGNNITFAIVYEIQKMGAKSTDNPKGIELFDWVDTFKYTTVFDFNNPETLPFSFSVKPSKLPLRYVINDEKIINRPVNNQLPVGEYEIDIKIEDDNHYFMSTNNFEIEKLDAEIICPSVITYTYANREIDSFLQGIGAVLKDKDGNTTYTVSYYSRQDTFTKTFYLIYEKEEIEFILSSVDNKYHCSLEDIDNPDDPFSKYAFENYPKAVGDYKIHIEYDDDNYFGEKDYSYSIVKRPYIGAVTFADPVLTYSPLSTMQTFVDSIIKNNNIFSTNLQKSEYTLKLEDVKTGTVLYDETRENQYNNDAFETYYVVGQMKIRITLKFVDETIAQYSQEAWLTIKAATITNKNLLSYTNESSSYIYTGYEFYQDLAVYLDKTNTENWKGRLIPTMSSSVEIIQGDYRYNIKYQDNVYLVKDNLNKEVFSVKYTYYKYSEESANLDKYDEIDYYPIVPGFYKVAYKILTGNNYSSLGIFASFTERYYEIQKANTLYISFDNSTKIFNGNNLAQAFIPHNFLVTNTKDLSSTNMKVNSFVYGLSPANDYLETYGVYLRLYFTDESNNICETVKDVGYYKINLSLICFDEYVLSDFFNNICIVSQDKTKKTTRTIKSIEEIMDESNKITRNNVTIYNNVAEGWLEVQKVTINQSNYSLAVTFAPASCAVVMADCIEVKSGTRLNSISEGFIVELCNSSKTVISTNPLNYTFTYDEINEASNTLFLHFTGSCCNDSYLMIVIVE